MSQNRKIQYLDNGDICSYYSKGISCCCGANCWHKEYDGKEIFAVCNACGHDIGKCIGNVEEQLKKENWK